jgi:putative endonuclease
MADRRQAETRGRRAEALAAWALRLKGYRVLARRYRSPAGEIDLVVRRGRHLAAVEVKARHDVRTALESIGLQQRQRIVRAVHFFLHQNPHLVALPFRFDVVVVVPGRWPRHLRDAWRPD